MFDHARVHVDLSRVMAAENAVEVVQCRQIILSALVPIPDRSPASTRRCLGGKLFMPRLARAQAEVLPEGELSFYNVHTDERLRVRYRDERGQYDLTALDDLNHILRCHHTGEVVQCRQIILSALVPIPDTQPLIGVNVVERQFALKRKSFRKANCRATTFTPMSGCVSGIGTER